MARETVPADIAAAIEDLLDATHGEATTVGYHDKLDCARSRLDAAILHHLRSYDEMKAALELQTSGAA